MIGSKYYQHIDGNSTIFHSFKITSNGVDNMNSVFLLVYT